MSQKFYSIKCTNCNAPLDILGGGRVATITCKYCKSLLDLNNDYKVLAQFQSKHRPSSKLQIGMRGFVRGIEWVIIGMIEYVSNDSANERRLDFFLYSKLYGYAWLTEEDEALYFTRRIRDFSVYTWESKGKPNAIFYDGGHYIQKEEPYFMYADYIEGELSWIAKHGDVSEFTDFYGANQRSISIERNQREIETYKTIRLNSNQVIESFSLTDKDSKKLKKNSLEEEVFVKFPPYLRKGTWAMAILLMITLLLSIVLGNVVYKSDNLNTQVIKDITISHNDFLGKITIDAKNSTDLSAVAMSLLQISSGKLYFTINNRQVFYLKERLGRTWSSRDDRAVVYLKLDKGQYTLKANIPHGVKIKIEEEIVRLSYIVPMLIIVMFMLLYLYSDERFGTVIKYGIVAMAVAAIFIFDIPLELIMIMIFVLFVFFGSQGRRDSSGITYASWGSDWDIYD